MKTQKIDILIKQKNQVSEDVVMILIVRLGAHKMAYQKVNTNTYEGMFVF